MAETEIELGKAAEAAMAKQTAPPAEGKTAGEQAVKKDAAPIAKKEGAAAAKKESASAKPAAEGQKKLKKLFAIKANKPPEEPALNEMLVDLDDYDDIFSDFDPRPYSQRELSDDMLKELGRRYVETPKGKLEVHFTIPANLRDAKTESEIKKRLKEHFVREGKSVNAQILARKHAGMRYAAAGVIFLIAEVLLITYYPDTLETRLMGILITPAGWFSLWTGLERLVESPYNLKQLQSFYERFSKCAYIFVSE